MKAIIMAAGQSTRTAPLTLTRPKPLLPIMNKPLLARQLDALQRTVDSIVVVVGYMREAIEREFGSQYGGLPIEYVVQAEQKGTGHAILQCRDVIDGPFLAMNGDDLYDPGDLKLLSMQEQGALAKEVPDPRLYGVFEVDGDGNVTRLIEKPTESLPNLASIGAYKFTPDIFRVLEATAPSPRGEIEITSAIQTIARSVPFRAVTAKGYWLPIGYPWHLLDANEYFLENCLEPGIEGQVHPQAVIEGPVYIGKDSVVRSGVVINGPVYIGANADIGPNCWLRPGATLGNDCRVGHGSEVKNSILMEGAAAPHLNYVGDSVIGAHANLGCGTIVANLRHDHANVRSVVKGELIDTGRRKLGAIIGDHVHTGINTSILPGRKLWPGVGTTPGEVISRDKTK